MCSYTLTPIRVHTTQLDTYKHVLVHIRMSAWNIHTHGSTHTWAHSCTHTLTPSRVHTTRSLAVCAQAHTRVWTHSVDTQNRCQEQADCDDLPVGGADSE